MANSQTLDPEPNQSPVYNKDNPAVKTALDVISKNWDVKNERDSINRWIQDLFEKGFEVRNPRGTQKISSKKLFQALWRMASRMKPLDFTIHGTSRPREIEKIVTDGVSTIMDEGGYIDGLRSKGGMFYKLLLFGDAFMSVGANPEPGTPIVFNPISNTNIYVDQYATDIRSQGWGRDATKMVAIFSYSWAEFISMFPEAKKKAGIGKIPRGDADQRELEREKDYDNYRFDDLIEVAYFYDINAKRYTVFAGSACTVISDFKGDNYPFVMDDKPYIPIMHYLCFPSSEGFYNYGVGNMIYDLAIVSRRLLNMEVAHIEDNTYPIELVNVPQGEASKFFNKLSMAHEMRAAGKKGYVAMEYDPTNPGSGAVQSQTLLTQNLTNEWQLVYDMLDRELARMGINLDDVDRGPNITATQILAEEESQNAFIKQIMEYNASESKFAVELTMDFITQFISKNSKKPVDLTITLELPGGEIQQTGGITMGMISDELKKNNYFVRVNARTGAIPSNVLRQAQISRGLSLAAPGSGAQVKLMKQFAQLNDLDIPGEDFITPFAQEQQGMPAEGGAQGANLNPSELKAASQPVASGTDRMTIDAMKMEQNPIL